MSLKTFSAEAFKGILEDNSWCCRAPILESHDCGQCPENCCQPTDEEYDPLEPMNRVTFEVNGVLDMMILEPIAMMYTEIIPECIRTRIGYVLRNLGEPIVLVNNILQGDAEEARVTLGRFLVNSTVGLVGIFDVSTDWGLPYKKTDLGLTFASWGVDAGPYIVLPILGPSNARDAWGRAGDFTMDPVNMYGYAVHSTTKAGVQIIDVKTDTIDFLRNLRENSVDYYAAIRSWYSERRAALIKGEQPSVDTPKPDDE